MNTTIEWLFEQLWETPKDKFVWNSILQEALEKEKKQIIEAHTQGHNDCYEYHFLKNSANEIAIKEGEEYYNQTYNK